MRQITVEQALRAYDLTGLTPMREGWYSAGNDDGKPACACPLAACAMAGMSPDARSTLQLVRGGDGSEEVGRILGLSPAYVLGFVDGFDDDLDATGLPDAVYVKGYSDGSQVRCAIYADDA